ncbi:hypothetical protein BAE30_05705 [Acidithiobacillus caldus]|uniref:Uncharacterized protein n=1 Tax=Acidithiobacillus caldus TaxID=33059 RepID=A0A1E7YXH3_9PROT|nr:hypothetical protein BAE30_05705 [Acidithiobacillus caldus]
MDWSKGWALHEDWYGLIRISSARIIGSVKGRSGRKSLSVLNNAVETNIDVAPPTIHLAFVIPTHTLPSVTAAGTCTTTQVLWV